MNVSFAAVLLLGTGLAHAESMNETIGRCWKGHDHLGMEQCVASHASTTRRAMEAVEADLRKRIAKDERDTEELKSAFHASVASYRLYRTDECRLHAVLASEGNGAGEIKLACEAELDAKRIENLRAGAWWLKE